MRRRFFRTSALPRSRHCGTGKPCKTVAFTGARWQIAASSARLFANILEAARFYNDEFENRSLLEQAKLPVLRDMRQVAKRFSDREKKLLREQQKYQEAEGLQKTAQMGFHVLVDRRCIEVLARRTTLLPVRARLG